MAYDDDLKQVGAALQLAGAALARLEPAGACAPAVPMPVRTPVPPGTDVTALVKAETEGPEAGSGSDKDSAKNAPVPTEASKDDPKSLFWDPFAIVEQLGYKDRPSQITYGTLKSIAWKTPVLHAVINTRVQQVASFCQPQHDRYKMGFRIKLRDTEKEPTKAERLWMKDMETLITRTGVTEHPRGRDNFETFLRKVTWDSLVYDQLAFEVIENKKGDPCEWYAVDASTMRLADTASTYLDEDLSDAVRFVQIYDGQVIAEFNQDELCFGVRNPRTDIRLFGYGVSELEMLVPTVTSLLWGFEYNQRFFSQGSSPKGIINFKGTIPERQLQQFRRHWYQMCSGVENSWRTPVVASDELQYVNLQQTSRDMEFNAWMDFLIKIACFPPETRVVLGDGSLVPINTIQPGDRVRTHMGHVRPVINVQVKEFTGELVTILSGDTFIRATPEHPFWVVRDAAGDDPMWIEAADLRLGDCLVTPGPDGPVSDIYRPVEALRLEGYDGRVYNMEVEGDHSYQVENCAVHNCSMYSMNPVEVNFQYGNTGQTSTLQSESNREKITESRERGLRPLLRFLAECMNQFIVWPINEAFEFDFVGLDAMTRDQTAELNTKRVKTVMTVDELRAEDDLPPLPDGKGEIILDPVYMQNMQLKDGQAQEGGFPGGDMGEGEADDEEGGDTDFESLLSEYEAKESGGKPAKPAKPGKPAESDEQEKSLRKSQVVVDIDL